MLKANSTLQKEDENETTKDGLGMIILEDDLTRVLFKT